MTNPQLEAPSSITPGLSTHGSSEMARYFKLGLMVLCWAVTTAPLGKQGVMEL